MPDEIKLNELSLNILDIVQNSIKANASAVHISVKICTDDNLLTIFIGDNGTGFDVLAYEKFVQEASLADNSISGHGIQLIKKSAEVSGGSFKISSTTGKGTELTAIYILNSPLRVPLGDICSTVEVLITCCTDVDFIYDYSVDGSVFVLDTREIKRILADIPINDPEAVKFIKSYLKENTENINRNRIY